MIKDSNPTRHENQLWITLFGKYRETEIFFLIYIRNYHGQVRLPALERAGPLHHPRLQKAKVQQMVRVNLTVGFHAGNFMSGVFSIYAGLYIVSI